MVLIPTRGFRQSAATRRPHQLGRQVRLRRLRRARRATGWRGMPGIRTVAGQRDAQHRADFRFAPTRPIFSTFAMYSVATGTLQSVSPMSTEYPRSAFAVDFASASSGLT